MAHQPNIADLKRLLGINLFLNLEGHALENNQQQGLVCSFAGLRLSSVFQPVVTAEGEIIGREALLRAVTPAGEVLSPQAAFAHAIAANKLVSFDRLVRTIHLFNHANAFGEHELIFLNVHPQLLTSVSDHGRTFERILHYYSVPTSRVVIEIQESDVKDDARLEDAVSNYRSLGYKIAIDNFGAGRGANDNLTQPTLEPNQANSIEGSGWLNRVLGLQPEFVKLDRSILLSAQQSRTAAYALHRLTCVFHSIGSGVQAQSVETADQLAIARNAGVDLVQGYLLGSPELVSAARGNLCRDERVAA
jgi:EAL domain-containing protein (putative c-di-GMP-specific phosphodiesterase class I)